MRALDKSQTGSGSTAKAGFELPSPASPVQIDPETFAELLGAMDERTVNEEETAALERLIQVAQGDTGQSRRVADFLLAWWNAASCGAFDLTTLWGLDTGIAKDMVTVFGLVAKVNQYPDSLGYEEPFKRIVREWRPEL